MKRVICLVLSFLMMFALVAACSDSGDTPANTPAPASPPVTSDGSQTTPEDPSVINWDEHRVFTIWMYSTNNELYSGYSHNPVINYLNQRFNVTLEFIQPPSGTEADALALMFGTGQYTDLIDVTTFTGSIGDLYSDGVIIDIANYLQYMPNLVAHMEADSNVRKQFYNDDGRILTLTNFSEYDQTAWGGMVYRHDLLEMMTGGNVSFPSGYDIPTTVEDWEYMLPLFKMFFEMAGMADFAPLIIPATGTFWFGELQSGFGFPSPGFYYDTRTNIVNHGYLTDGFYNYITKMSEWFEAGYIYRDFATRVGDMFFLPNPALTYGSAAGIWYGLQSQLGDSMSMPEHGLFFDVRPLSTPLDTANGITAESVISMVGPRYEDPVSFVVPASTTDIPRLLSIIDFMYSDDGGMLWQYGLTAEQIPENDTIYKAAGLSDGAYWFDDNGNFIYNPLVDQVGGPIAQSDIAGIRMPGFIRNRYNVENLSEEVSEANNIWTRHQGYFRRLPTKLSLPQEEENLLNTRMVAINDYANAMIPQFIMGSVNFDAAAFADFKAQLISLGLDDNIRLQQAAIERYMAR